MAAPTALSESARSRIKLYHASKVQAAAKTEIDAAEKKLTALRRKRNKLRHAANTADTNAEQAFQHYARTVCLEFCDSVFGAFPREVRDMIYVHLYEKRDMGIATQYFELGAVPEAYYAASHLWDPLMIGHAMHREICEHFYRFNSFNFYTNFSLLPEFRATDALHIGYVPAVLPTNVSVEIRCSNYDLEKETRRKPAATKTSNSNGWDNHEPNHKSRAELLSELELLFGFAPGSKCTVRITPSHTRWGWNTIDEQEQACNDFVPLVIPVLDRLRACANRVCIIIVDDEWEQPSGHIILEGNLSVQGCNDAVKERKAKILKEQQDAAPKNARESSDYEEGDEDESEDDEEEDYDENEDEEE